MSGGSNEDSFDIAALRPCCCLPLFDESGGGRCEGWEGEGGGGDHAGAEAAADSE